MATKINIEKAVREVEAKAIARAEARNAEAVEMAQALAKARAGFEAIEEEPDNLMAAARSGEEVAAAALVEARTRVEIETARIKGLETRLQVAKSDPAPSDADGAELLAPIVNEAAKGLPVIACAAPAKEVVEALNGAEGPAIILCQETGTARKSTGLISVDRVRAVFVRPTWAADLSLNDFEAPAREQGVQVKVRPGRKAGNFQTFDIAIESGAEELPLIPSVQEGSLGISGAVQGFGRSVMAALRQGGGLPTIRRGVYDFRGGEVAMQLAGVKWTEDIDAHGVRTVRISLGCHLYPGNMDRDYVRGGPHMVAPRGFTQYVGRLKSVEVKDSGYDPRGAAISQNVTLTYVSRVA